MNSEEKSMYYLIVNEKVPNMDSYFRHGRSSTNLCRHCNIMIETLSHLFSECRTADSMWKICFEHLRQINPIKFTSQRFDRFQFPELTEFSRSERENIVLVFSKYIHYMFTTPVTKRFRNELVELLR